MSFLPAIKKAMSDVEPDRPVSDIETMQNIVQDSLGSRRFPTLLLSAFALLALVLATVGHSRRGELFRGAAHSRNWNSHGAGGACCGCLEVDRQWKHDLGCDWNCGWGRRVSRPHSLAGNVAVQREAIESGGAGNCLSVAYVHRFAGELHSSAPGGEGRSHGGIAIRMRRPMKTLAQNARYSIRLLRKNPGFTSLLPSRSRWASARTPPSSA